MPSIRHKPYFQNKKNHTKNRISYHSGADTTHHGIDQIYRIKLQQIDTKKKKQNATNENHAKIPQQQQESLITRLARSPRTHRILHETRPNQIKPPSLSSSSSFSSSPTNDLWPPPLLGLANSHDARQRETREREKDEFFLRLSPSRSRYRLYIQSAYEIRIRIRLYEMTEVPLPQSLCGMVNLVSSVQRKVEPTKKLFFVFLFPLLC